MYEIKYRKPEEMKDSGVEWLGNVPIEWDNKPLKYVYKYEKGKNPSKIVDSQSGTIPYVNAEFLRTGHTENYVMSYKGLIKTNEQDIVLLWDGANAGEFLKSKEGALGSTFAKMIEISNYNYSYLKYSLKSQEKYLKSMTVGMGIPHVNSDVLKNLLFLIPKSIREQQKIANFLDIKTTQFDSIISKKEKLIEKLEEAKKSLVSEVVTGKVKIVDGQLVKRQPKEMKDSGVEWLGMVPKAWQIKKVKYALKRGKDGIKIGPFGSSLKLDEMNMCFPYKVYGQENLIKEDFNVGSRFINYHKFKQMKQYQLLENDIAISMMGTIGKSTVIPSGITIGIMDSHLIRLRVDETIADVNFLNLVIRESAYIKEQLNIYSNGSIMSGLNSTIIKNLLVVFPDLLKQKELIKLLNIKSDEFNTLINVNKRQIQKLKQAKQALISEAVTGKMDLRDWEIIEEGE